MSKVWDIAEQPKAFPEIWTGVDGSTFPRATQIEKNHKCNDHLSITCFANPPLCVNTAAALP